MKKEELSKHVWLNKNLKDFDIGCAKMGDVHAAFHIEHVRHHKDNIYRDEIFCDNCGENFTQEMLDIGAIKYK